MIKSKLIYSSKYPLSIFLGLLIDLFAIFTFLYYMIFEKFSIIGGFSYICLILIIVDLVICRSAGKIILYEDKLILKYVFPWYIDYEFKISDIKNLDVDKPYKKFYSNIFITLTNGTKNKYNIQSFYGSIEGIKILKEKYIKLKIE